MLAVIGRSAAVAHVFGRTFRGFAAWVLWLGIHIAWLIGFRNRALVLVNWAWNYVSFRRAVRLILPWAPVSAGDEGDGGPVGFDAEGERPPSGAPSQSQEARP